MDLGDHVCLLNEAATDQAKAIAAFLARGIEHGDRCIQLVDDAISPETHAALEAAGVDVRAEHGRGALLVGPARDAFLRAGAFSPGAMVAFLREQESAAHTDGFRGLRMCADMTWALSSGRGGDRLVEYENLLNRWLPGSHTAVLCQYARPRFDPRILDDALRTHPIAMLGDAVVDNLFFEPPDMASASADAAAGRVDWKIRQLLHSGLTEQELRRARDEAERASATKSQFLATMSHELRTPLNAVIGHSDLLLMGIPEPLANGARGRVERIAHNARHLLELIEAVLTFSGLQTGDETIEAGPVDLCSLLAEVERVGRAVATARGLHVVCRLPDQPVVVQTDETKVRQILLGLISNALKFTHQGVIGLSLGADNRDVVMHVTDTGPGIGKDDQEHIFEPFWQVERGTTRTAGGAGLGLSVCRRIARLLGGDVDVASAPGAGSDFTLRLPLSVPVPAARRG